MKIGVLKEIKKHEYRVGMTPTCVANYKRFGHELFIQKGAGLGAGFSDAEYQQAGAIILPSPQAISDTSDMIVKVKEPLPEEYNILRENQILFTYLHLAAAKELAEFLMNTNISCVAYETIELDDGSLPCLQPMSEIAGRLSIQQGAKYLEKPFGGRGILLGGVPGIRRGKIAILGGGIVGTNACKIASGIGAEVIVLDINPKRLAYLDDIFGSRITTLYSDHHTIKEVIKESDVVIGGVLITGKKAPKLISRNDLKTMKNGAVIVDVSIDQGGCLETSRPTTHDEPVYIEEGIVHYCVTNMPGVVALSSTLALTSQTTRYGIEIANKGLMKALQGSKPLQHGLNIFQGHCVHRNLAESLDLPYKPVQSLIE